MTQNQFLNRYNPSRDLEIAIIKSISAAVQHNKLYYTSDNKIRKNIRQFWKQELLFAFEEISRVRWDIETYETKIIFLKQKMNNQFTNLIDFRISHAQKSLGVFFKHLWCMNLINEPPQCPIDRQILKIAGVNSAELSWGFVNDIETHRRKYSYIKQAALKDGFSSVSEWELSKFEP